jgi:hypothetical protein
MSAYSVYRFQHTGYYSQKFYCYLFFYKYSLISFLQFCFLSATKLKKCVKPDEGLTQNLNNCFNECAGANDNDATTRGSTCTKDKNDATTNTRLGAKGNKRAMEAMGNRKQSDQFEAPSIQLRQC